MERGLIGFIICFLVFVYSVIFRKWENLYFALPGMFVSALVIVMSIL